MTEQTPSSRRDINADSYQENSGNVSTGGGDVVANVGQDFHKTVNNQTYNTTFNVIAQQQQDGIKLEGKRLLDIDTLVQKVREQVRDYVEYCCGTMRVLDMTQAIELGNIYTNVNILEKLISRQRLGIDELMQGCTLENFDRLGLGRVTEERILGIDAANKYPHMMVLGKPGSGKTTFLKYLAISCIGERFQGNRVPIFVTLRSWASDDNKPNLLEFVSQELAKCEVANTETVELFKKGRVLLLLDGLDEVLKEDSKRVIEQIQNFSNQYRRNVMVITCRIAAREYTFQGFTEVEVADFDDEQIQIFVEKWFQHKNSVKAKRFIEKLEYNESVKELANNPLLLTLLCLVFEENTDFPSNRAQIYREGLDILLKKWDTSRNIERDIIYKNLSYNRKEDLLSQIAWRTFERGVYFFWQDIAKKYIADYIINLPEAQTDTEALLVDSEAVLKSIESQHGLVVERAKYIYSFSHLTFQEYFAARRVIATDKTLSTLASMTSNRRWREVFLLAFGILQDGSQLLLLLLLMKQQIDNLVAADQKIQQFLAWVNKKSASIEATYKPAAIKAFYFALDLALNGNLDYCADIGHSQFSESYLDRHLPRSLDSDLDLDRYLAQDLDLDLYFTRAIVLFPLIDLDLDRIFDFQLKEALHQLLKHQFPDFNDYNKFFRWWKINGSTFIKKLRSLIIKYRNICHNWQFNDEQKDLLKTYYSANQLLVDCLNSNCYVSREVRQEIEETLFQPISDIRKPLRSAILKLCWDFLEFTGISHCLERVLMAIFYLISIAIDNLLLGLKQKK